MKFLLGLIFYAFCAQLMAASDAEQYYRALDLKGQGRYVQAVELWRNLAQTGDPRSQFYLGLMYEDGTGVARSDEQAISWYKKAAAQRLPDALLNLGALYARLKHYHRARDYFQRSIAVGHQQARDNLQRLMEFIENYQLVVIKSATLRETPMAQGKIVRRVAKGLQGYEMRKKGAWVQVSLPGPQVGWLRLRQVQSDRLDYETGVKAHTFGQMKKAFQVWLTLARKGHDKAQIMLARLYLEGKGVSKDYEQAIIWSEKALSQGALSHKVQDFTRQTILLAKRGQAQGQ